MTAGAVPKPDPAAITGLSTGVAFVGAIVGAMRLAKGPIPRPGAPAADIRAYYTDSARAARFSTAGQLVSILSLARFTLSVARAARDDSRWGRALPAGALLTGGAAVASLATSAATHLSLTVPRERGDAELTRSARRVFVAGGPVHGVWYGLFTAVVAAVGRDAGLLRRPATTTGVASAVAGILSPAYFRWENAGWLIPIGRFGGYVVSGILGVRLARRRHGDSTDHLPPGPTAERAQDVRP
jgi:hypothetical protein